MPGTELRSKATDVVPGGGVDDDRKYSQEKDHRHLRGGVDTEHEDEQRRKRDRRSGVDRRNPGIDDVVHRVAAGDGDTQEDAEHRGDGEADEELVQAHQDVALQFAAGGELQEFGPDVGNRCQDQRPLTAATGDLPQKAHEEQ